MMGSIGVKPLVIHAVFLVSFSWPLSNVSANMSPCLSLFSLMWWNIVKVLIIPSNPMRVSGKAHGSLFFPM